MQLAFACASSLGQGRDLYANNFVRRRLQETFVVVPGSNFSSVQARIFAMVRQSSQGRAEGEGGVWQDFAFGPPGKNLL